MKKYIAICILLCSVAAVFGQNTQSNNLGRVLILYYSWSDAANTEKVANILRGMVNADIIEIESATPVVTLLRQTDFGGKPVAVFGTHQGNGSKILGDFSTLARNARIVRGELFTNVARDNRIEEKVTQWVRGLRM
jgi:flavodoxin